MNNKEENVIFKPLVPKWIDKKEYWKLSIPLTQSVNCSFLIDKNLDAFCCLETDTLKISHEEIGKCDTLEEAKNKVNEAIKWLGETLVYYSENIRIKAEK